MKTVSLTTALGRLLADTDLRRQFINDPERVAEEMAIREEDRSALLALDVNELDRQAETLIDKRFHEVCGIIPRTIARLGCKVHAIFHRFATNFWPTSHRRHQEDALEFLDFLISDQQSQLVCRSEYNWMKFRLGRRRIALHLVSDLVVGKRRRRAIQFLYRRRDGIPRQFAFYLYV